MYITKINNRTFDNFITEFFGYQQNQNNVLSNIKEDENSYELELVLPGFKKQNIKIDIDNDILKISSEIEKHSNENYSKMEYFKQSFEKSYYLPKDINKDSITAKMEDGILQISLLKEKNQNLIKTIQIN